VVNASLAAGCLGGLRHDTASEAVALAPRQTLALPVRENQPHWLLHGQPGWCGAQEVRYGGAGDDPAVAAVRAARFRDDATATQAFSRLTAQHLYLTLRDRIVGPPRPFDYPQPLAGDEVAVMLYDARLPPSLGPDVSLTGQLTVVRAGRVVLLIESIGVHPEQLVPAVMQLTDAAAALTSAC
jgi:hypothetical protein